VAARGRLTSGGASPGTCLTSGGGAASRNFARCKNGGAGLYWWLAPSTDFSGRTLGSLTVKEIGGAVAFLCVVIMWWRAFFNYDYRGDEDAIGWEGWGRFGLGLVASP
jgi:hypothetical protein